MVDIKFVVKDDKIVEVECGDYRFLADAQLGDRNLIKECFEKLEALGIQFTESKKKQEEMYRKYIKDLTKYQRIVLALFTSTDEVSRKEIEVKTDLKGTELAGVLGGLTRRAVSLGIIEKGEQALIWIPDKEIYVITPK